MKFADPTLLQDDGTRCKETAVVPPPLKRQHIPGWLRKRLTPHRRRLDAYDVHETLGFLTSQSGHWLDHWGSTTYDGKEFLVAEPYTLCLDTMRAIITFADLLDLDFTVHAASSWYPTQTIRIMFLPRTEGDNQETSFLVDDDHLQFFGK